MAVLVFLVVAAACVFFLYALAQFWLDEKRERQRRAAPLGFPAISSGHVVMPLEPPREGSAPQKPLGTSGNRR